MNYGDLQKDTPARRDVDRRLARLHRQVLGDGGPARARHADQRAASPIQTHRRRDDLPDELRRDDAARRRRRARRPSDKSYVFAGAKVESIIDSYEQAYGFDRLELLIDWGWFHFITKPMFYLIRFLYGILGNFGLAILAVTVIVKALFFPLANRSYASMAAMRRVQPEMKAIQERFKDDRPAQQQAMMELYKKEKINPLSGCWPILDPDPGVLRALQGAVRHHRDAARAVLRLDPGPRGARSDQHLHPVRPDPLEPDGAAAHRRLPRTSASGR